MRVPAFAFLAKILLIGSLASCTQQHPRPSVPAPDELAPISAELRNRILAHKAALQEQGLAKTRPALERTLAEIELEYGRNSVAVPQSITEAGLMIMREGGGYGEDVA